LVTWKRRLGIISGNIFEYYDIAVYGVIYVYIAENFFSNSSLEQSIIFVWGIFAIRFLMRPIGGFIIGLYADQYGRKKALILTSSLIGVATISMAILPTYSQIGIAAPLILLLLQMIQSFCFGGEYPVIICYLLETSKKESKTKVSALIVASCLVGVLMAQSLILILEYNLSREEMVDFGWRIPLFLGIFNIVLSFYFKFKLVDKVPLAVNKSRYKVDKKSILKVFLISIPAGIVFYVNATAGRILINVIDPSDAVKLSFPLLSNVFFIIFIVFVGWLFDRYSSSKKAMDLGVYCLIILSAPLYAILDTGNVVYLVIANTGLLFISALILAPTCAVIFSQVKGTHKAVSLGVGFNSALSIFGGITPLVITLLSPYELKYTGLIIGLFGFTYLYSMRIKSS